MIQRKVRPIMGFCFVVFVLVSFVACATFTRNTYRMLSVSSATYEASMRSFAELYNQGQATEQEKADVIMLGTKFWNAYHLTSDALGSYITVDSADNSQKLDVAIAEFAKALSTFMNYINPILGR